MTSRAPSEPPRAVPRELEDWRRPAVVKLAAKPPRPPPVPEEIKLVALLITAAAVLPVALALLLIWFRR